MDRCKLLTFFTRYSLHLAWIVSLASLIGSLYFSEVMRLTPCPLCWYQRIALFPLALILPVGLALQDKRIFWYAAPLTVTGLALSLYHNLIYFGFSGASALCGVSNACLGTQVKLFGVLDIPQLSLIGAAVILGLLLIHRQSSKSDAA